MTTKISITDVGTWSHAEVENGVLRVTRAGGCPVEEILGKIDLTKDVDELASEVLSAWCDGYDGDPAENGLTVEITRGDETGVARA